MINLGNLGCRFAMRLIATFPGVANLMIVSALRALTPIAVRTAAV